MHNSNEKVTQWPNIVETFCLTDFSKVFKFKFVHLGGDEVNTSKFDFTLQSGLYYYCYLSAVLLTNEQETCQTLYFFLI